MFSNILLVKIHWSFFVILFSIIYQFENLYLGISTSFMFIFSIILHELGIITAAEYYGYRAEYIILSILGGQVKFLNKILDEKIFILTNLAGIASNLFFAFVMFSFYLFLNSLNIKNKFADSYSLIFGSISLFWALINFLPVHPLDGGRIFKYLLGTSSGHDIAMERSRLPQAALGIVIFLFGLYYLNPGFMIIGFYIFRIS